MEQQQSEIKQKINQYWLEKRVLITGGTAGLGMGLAKYLTKLGAHVAIIARDVSRLNKLKEENDSIIAIQADISKKDDIHKIVGKVIGQFGESIEVLINNASSLGIIPLQTLVDTPCENFTDILETNLLGPFRLIKSVLPSMILKKSGLIVNITSDASINAYPTWGIYGVSKAALDHLTAIWSKELEQITFLSIDPGDMLTEMHMQADPEADKLSLYDPNKVAEDLSFFLSKSRRNLSKTRFSSTEWRKYLS